MKLTVFNGSPRGINSNSKALIDYFIKGYTEVNDNSYDLFYLNKTDETEHYIRQFHNSDNVIFAFPLYIDSIPALLKSFIERLGPGNNNKSVGFIVQSGFPESNQFINLVKYLKKLTARNNWFYNGTVVRGAGEGIRIGQTIKKPIHKVIHYFGRKTNIGGVGYFLNNKRTFRLLYHLGQYYGRTGEFNEGILKKLAKPHKLSKVGFLLYSLIGENLYFNIMLRKSNAFSNRFDKPYSNLK